MLTICIPVFRYDVRPLLEALIAQCQELGVRWEICCIDDASGADWEVMLSEIARMKGVRLEVLGRNIGRAAIRNRLQEMARYEYLLFLDGDSGIIRDDFIAQYVALAQPDRVLYGGRVYDRLPPKNQSFLLHWTYGRQREMRTMEFRRKHPYHGFMTNNYLIPKLLAQKTPFAEELTQYGHEDTLFGVDLEREEIPVIHLDNPIEHLDLEEGEVFLEKTIKALQNLARLYQDGEVLPTKLTIFYFYLKRFGLLGGFSRLAEKKQHQWRANLLGDKPKLRLLDAYKLYYFIQEMKSDHA